MLITIHIIFKVEANSLSYIMLIILYNFREYRRAFEKLRLKELSSTVACDRPPQMGTLFCRKLFRDLTI